RRSRDNWRTNCVNTRAPISFEPGLRAGNNKDVLVAGRLSIDVIHLLMKIPLHAAAYRRIELGEVADLHGIGDFRLPIAELCEAARRPFSSRVMRTVSFAPLDPLCEQPSLIRQSAFGNRNSVLGPAKIFLRLQCRGTTHSRSGNGLLVKAIGHVAGDENSG